MSNMLSTVRLLNKGTNNGLCTHDDGVDDQYNDPHYDGVDGDGAQYDDGDGGHWN